MRKPSIVSLLGLLFVIGGTGLRADEPQELPTTGARIRVVTVDGISEGRLAAHDAEKLTLHVKGDGDPVVIPRSALTGLYVSGGRAKGKAAGIGALIGIAVAGALVAAGADGIGCDASECLCSGSGCATALALLGAPAAATGALVGASVAPERWREVTFPAPSPAPGARGFSLTRTVSHHVRMGVVLVRDGVGGSLSCSF